MKEPLLWYGYCGDCCVEYEQVVTWSEELQDYTNLPTRICTECEEELQYSHYRRLRPGGDISSLPNNT